MSRVMASMQQIADTYLSYLKEESKKKNMTPKEYGIMLQKKQKKRK